MDWAGHDRVDLPAAGQGGGFFQGGRSRPRGVRRRRAERAIRVFADDAVIRRNGQPFGVERGANDLRPYSGTIAQCNPDANRHPPVSARRGPTASIG